MLIQMRIEMINKLFKVTFITLFCLQATACVEGKYSQMTDQELAKKQKHCDSIPKKSAVFANGCERIRKEIEQRK